MRESQTLRLLLISNMYPSENEPGYGIFVRSIEQGLVKNGVLVDRIVIAGRGRNWIHKLTKYLVFYFRILTAPLQTYDVVQVGYPSHSYAPLSWRRLGGTLLAVRMHGLDLLSDPVEETMLLRIGRWFTRLAIRRADLVVVPSRYFRDELEKTHMPAAVHVYPSGGVNLQQFRPDGSDELHHTVGYVGRIDPLKGVDVFLHGLTGVSLPVRAIIAGQGSLQQRMEALSDKLGLSDRVRFTGWVPHEELWRLYNQMDVFVFPTMRKAESFGNVAIEAMACGIPVIGSRISGLTEYLEDGINGFFVEPGDSEALSRSLDRFYSLSDQQRSRLREGALETAKRFEQQSVSAGYVSRIRQLMALKGDAGRTRNGSN